MCLWVEKLLPRHDTSIRDLRKQTWLYYEELGWNWVWGPQSCLHRCEHIHTVLCKDYIGEDLYT